MATDPAPASTRPSSTKGDDGDAGTTFGAATGIGSWPGTDPMAAARITFQELGEPPYLPYLPELPARGPGADLVGRAAALLVEMPVDLQPSGWRLVDHAGRDLNRAKSFLRQDLDVLAEVADGYRGRLKLQVAGPWTLASTLWLPRLERAVADPGAVRDLIGSLAEGVARHVAEVAGLLPGVEIVLQVDEPGVTAVVEGSLPTASGFGRLRAVDEPVIVEGLREVLDAATHAGAVGTVLHSCAAGLPLRMLAKAGAGALSVDVALLGLAGWEQLAEILEGGTSLWAGAVPTSPSALNSRTTTPDMVADSVWRPWQRLGLTAADAAAVVITPACGLAEASPQQARAALVAAKHGARILADRALS
jgi:Cobalamin-independent synthase, Catalytic domain